MIKNTTLLVLLCAIVLGGAVYYFNTRQAKDTKTSDTPVTLFSLQPADVNRIEVAHPAKPGGPAMRFEKTNSGWQITQPLQTGADEAAVEGIVDQLAAVSSSETEPGTPDRLKAYGLDPAAVSLRVRLRNGTEHTILMGDKDFAGSAVYAVVDGGKAVALLPQLLLTSTDKSADDLRDKTVLAMASDQVAVFTLKNGASELAAAKVKDQWRFSKPEDALADQDAIQALLSAVETAKMAAIVSEKPDNLSKYGLASPAATFTATNDVGKTSTLAVGQKKGDTYYARDLARPAIFTINDDLHMQLAKTFTDLRDKKVAHFDPADITHAEIHDDHGTIVADSKPDGSWQIESAGPEKGKTASSSKIFDPITALRAEEVVDRPAGNVPALLAKPAVEYDLKDKDGKTITLAMSKPDGDFFYARTSDGPAVYKLKKQDFDGLELDATHILP